MQTGVWKLLRRSVKSNSGLQNLSCGREWEKEAFGGEVAVVASHAFKGNSTGKWFSRSCWCLIWWVTWWKSIQSVLFHEREIDSQHMLLLFISLWKRVLLCRIFCEECGITFTNDDMLRDHRRGKRRRAGSAKHLIHVKFGSPNFSNVFIFISLFSAPLH